MTGDVTAAVDGLRASSANGEVHVSVIGDVTAGGIGVSDRNLGSGDVGVIQSGNVSAGADGLVAGLTTGDATVTVRAGTVTVGANGIRVIGFGNLSATVAADAVVIGGAGAAAILLDGGLINTVTNRGTIRNAGGFDDYAISAAANDTLVENHGTIGGNILLGAWANDINNHFGAFLETGTILNLGAGNTVSNAGTISPGGTGNVIATSLIGNLATTETSRLAFDVDMLGGSMDQINVGGTAAVAGSLTLSFLSVSKTPFSYDFITAADGVTAQNIGGYTNAFVNSSVVTSGSGAAVTLTLSDLDFAPSGISGGVGGYLNRALAAGGAGVGVFGAAIVNNGTLEGAQAIYDSLLPSVPLEASSGTYAQSRGFADGMMNCAVASGLSAAIREGSCDWTRMTTAAAAAIPNWLAPLAAMALP